LVVESGDHVPHRVVLDEPQPRDDREAQQERPDLSLVLAEQRVHAGVVVDLRRELDKRQHEQRDRSTRPPTSPGRVVHGAHRLRVQLRYRDLERTFPTAAYVKVRTSGRRFDIQTSRNTPEGRTQLTRGKREDVVHCPGLRSSVDGARDQLTVSVPTTCLGNPAWVQVGVLSVVVEVEVRSELEEPYFSYFDDAHMTGGFEDHGVRVGPRVLPG
jgi:hypothetical protein